jgi:hypothetical protein
LQAMNEHHWGTRGIIRLELGQTRGVREFLWIQHARKAESFWTLARNQRCGRRRKIDSQREGSSADRDPLYVQRIYELQSRSLFRKSNDGGGRCVNSAEFVLLTKLPIFAATDGN